MIKDKAPVGKPKAKKRRGNGKSHFPSSVAEQKKLIKKLFKGIDISTITHIKASKDFILVHKEAVHGPMRKQEHIELWISLKRAMIWLREQGFIQVNRSTVVNIRKATLYDDEKVVKLNNGENIKVGKKYFDAVWDVF
jgi:DNA-binding LytR/AlgR family response regulator